MQGELVFIDFETTGLSAGYDRVIEVAAALVRDGEVAGTFVHLMHPGHRLPGFITQLTGITDAMLKDKPRPEAVMPELRGFIGDRACVAHNASFDSSFYHAEMSRAGAAHDRAFLCTMKLSRRLVEGSPDHKLGTLIRHLRLPKPKEGNCHRALYDVLLTVELWKHLEGVVSERLGGKEPGHEVYHALMKKPKAAVPKYLDKLAGEMQSS